MTRTAGGLRRRFIRPAPAARRTGQARISGEVTTKAHADLPTLVREKILEIGYDSSKSAGTGPRTIRAPTARPRSPSSTSAAEPPLPARPPCRFPRPDPRFKE
ncbi:hypothetical protein GCM10010387_50860 [Streptomyces inusitatus]|uniref:Uncharacterized protein n=1 Tax=Streptomyces inusitatus TaxID=68221 RepID=A0A918UZU4_9ACTN|nr:hypothetical protein GCM10010387_50860 [Streptomyces inusitatus]